MIVGSRDSSLGIDVLLAWLPSRPGSRTPTASWPVARRRHRHRVLHDLGVALAIPSYRAAQPGPERATGGC